jgi:transposase
MRHASESLTEFSPQFSTPKSFNGLPGENNDHQDVPKTALKKPLGSASISQTKSVKNASMVKKPLDFPLLRVATGGSTRTAVPSLPQGRKGN